MSEEFENRRRIELVVFIPDESGKDKKVEDFRIDKIEIFEDGELYLEAYSKKNRIGVFLSISGETFLNLLGEYKYRLFKAIENAQRKLSDAKDVIDKSS